MKSDKELYKRLRTLSAQALWDDEVPRFNQATPRERMANVALIRAIGVVFSATAPAKLREQAHAWLVGLLDDPSEKIRRYAMAALPKLGGAKGAENRILGLLHKTDDAREKRHIGQALVKLGGAETLKTVAERTDLPTHHVQKVRANIAREEQPSTVRLDMTLSPPKGMRIHLRCRRGLELVVRDEVEEAIRRGAPLEVIGTYDQHIAVSPTAPFRLADLYRLRCFATIGFALGFIRSPDPADVIEDLADLITGDTARLVMKTFTAGALRYRLEFVGRSHQRSVVHKLATAAFERSPELLNDSRQAPWSMDVFSSPRGTYVELRPRIYPDPRLAYRQGDVKAASHPPLAACMARLAGNDREDVVWDPFCGSGLELVECGLFGKVAHLIGTDISPEAIDIARANLQAANLKGVKTTLASIDFRKHALVPALGPNSVSLVISNPPMGRRIRIQDLERLVADFFAVATRVLKPGGRIVFVNPLRMDPPGSQLEREFRSVVDLGGFDARLELYRKKTQRPSRPAAEGRSRMVHVKQGNMRPKG